jgi:hypothetical protein
MARRLLIAQFETLLPLAVKWAAAVEARVLREGVPLNEQELADARAMGVREPGRVRLLVLDCSDARKTALMVVRPGSCIAFGPGRPANS